jgi:hypothetical protein
MSSFWDLPIPGIVLALFVGMMVAYEVGIRAHNRLRARADSKNSGSSDEGFILSGVLGLLALLMAFSFSMAVGRYESRRELMLTEANAISSFDLMAEAVEAPLSDQMRAQLRPYASARILASSRGTRLPGQRRGSGRFRIWRVSKPPSARPCERTRAARRRSRSAMPSTPCPTRPRTGMRWPSLACLSPFSSCSPPSASSRLQCLDMPWRRSAVGTGWHPAPCFCCWRLRSAPCSISIDR